MIALFCCEAKSVVHMGSRERAGNSVSARLSVPTVSYAAAIPMSGLVACPFCRELFERGEAPRCPACGLELLPLAALPPSHDALAEGFFEPDPPQMQALAWTYAGRGRAALVALACLGLGCFFAPWVHETAPEIVELSGFDLARRIGWLWSTAVAWFVMIPLVISRRSIQNMRGARVAVAFLAAIALVTVATRLAFPPPSSVLRPVRFDWAWGLYGSGIVALAALAAAVRFGGRLDDLPSDEQRPEGATLH